MAREGGPSPKDMGIEIGSEGSDLEFATNNKGESTDVIKAKVGKQLPAPPEGRVNDVLSEPFPAPEEDPKGRLP